MYACMYVYVCVRACVRVRVCVCSLHPIRHIFFFVLSYCDIVEFLISHVITVPISLIRLHGFPSVAERIRKAMVSNQWYQTITNREPSVWFSGSIAYWWLLLWQMELPPREYCVTYVVFDCHIRLQRQPLRNMERTSWKWYLFQNNCDI